MTHGIIGTISVKTVGGEMRRPQWSVGNMGTHMALVVSEEKTLVNIFLEPYSVPGTYIFYTYTGLGFLSRPVRGLIHVECDGDESNLQECIVDTDLRSCSHVGVVTQCYSCKYIVSLNTCGVKIECISCPT